MERIGREVERELSRGGSRDALPLAAITAAWPAAVGEQIARQAWPLRIGRDGTLHVATTSATWAFELDRMAAEIAERLAARLGEARPPAKLRFAIGPVPEHGSLDAKALGTSPAPPEPTPEEAAEAAEAASAIDDPDLRELVARAARASLARARSDRGF